MYKLIIILTLSLIPTIFLHPDSSFAGDGFLVATVDMNRLLNESKFSVGKKKELDQLSQQRRKEFEGKKESLKKLEDKLKADKVSPESAQADEFRAQARDFARLVSDAENDLKRKYLKTTQELTEQARKAIGTYAKANNIDMVLEQGSDLRSPVLYGQASMDITDKILEALN
ncbi:MAG: OmpH family outer membrane protein [Bdellovibrionales bacterium]|nr:OmpH family outer membrane protein [Bdellovibrionales bacterium]